MIYLKVVMSPVTAMLVALVAGPWRPFRGIIDQRATGLAAVAGSALEATASPLFWLSVMVLFALIFAAGQIKNKVLQLMLFWCPTLCVSTLALGLAALITYAAFHLRSS